MWNSFLNTDGKHKGELKLSHQVGVIRHEFRHTEINHEITRLTGVQYATDRDKVIHEAIATTNTTHPQLLRPILPILIYSSATPQLTLDQN